MNCLQHSRNIFNKLEKQWLAPHLVILDELGYVLSVKSEQNCCSSSALPDMRGQPDHNYKLRISKMDGGVSDEQMTAALLDRLTHNAHILNINVKATGLSRLFPSRQIMTDFL